MSKLLQGAMLQQARSYSQKTFGQIRVSPPKESTPPPADVCPELCAEKRKMMDLVQDTSQLHWKKQPSSQNSGSSSSCSNTTKPNVDSCRELCKEKSHMMSVVGGLTPPRGGAWTAASEGTADPPCAMLTSVKCERCGWTLCCMCSSAPSMRVLRSQYWSRPQDKYRLNVSVSIHEKVGEVRDKLVGMVSVQ
ncbi:hypothetical protein BaRGS_00000427 [Batillaria attramentaria]|uniref:Uncharacterized protein n=1 Tax=Batillaria attramentaria TaxID=370345 RepID=A0ABD0MAB5_9CAEN